MALSRWSQIPRDRRRLLVAMALIMVVVRLLDHAGSTFGWYSESYAGYDKLVHFLAGAFCGAFALWVFHPAGIMYDRFASIFWGITLPLVVGFWWEVWELYWNQPDLSHALYWWDSGLDLVADALGGVVFAVLALCMSRKR